MSWLTALFNSKEIVTKGVELADDTIRGVGRWIDNLSLTDQEKAELQKEAMNKLTKFMDKRLEESQARTISRRVMSWAIMGTFLAIVVLGAFSWFFSPGWSAFLIDWVAATKLDWLVVSVGSFYYGGHYLLQFFGASNNKETPK